MKSYFITNFTNILIIYYYQVNVTSGKGLVLSNCLLVMIEKFKKAIETGNEFGALLTDLSKAFACINHPLLITKLYNYGVSLCLLI